MKAQISERIRKRLDSLEKRKRASEVNQQWTLVLPMDEWEKLAVDSQVKLFAETIEGVPNDKQ